MRHWVVLILFLLALGALRMVGCGDENPCGNCDDGNPCTRDTCVSDELVLCEVARRCEHPPVTNGTPCGSGEVCVEGVCGENLCEGVVCEDDDMCTDDTCDYVDGLCKFPPTTCDDRNECTVDTCDRVDGCIFTPIEDREGDICEALIGIGICEAGVCLGCDPASQEELQCPIDGLESLVCCPGMGLCLDTCALCNPASEVEYQCLINEELFCCPGNEYCMDDCSNGS